MKKVRGTKKAKVGAATKKVSPLRLLSLIYDIKLDTNYKLRVKKELQVKRVAVGGFDYNY